MNLGYNSAALSQVHVSIVYRGLAQRTIDNLAAKSVDTVLNSSKNMTASNSLFGQLGETISLVNIQLGDAFYDDYC